MRNNKITSDDPGGSLPREEGSTENQGPLAQPTIINSQRVAARAWPKTQMLFNLN